MLARIAIVVVALIVAFVGAVFIVAGFEVQDTPTCRDVNAGVEQPREGECYDGSTSRRALQAGLSIAAGGFAVLALIPAIGYAATRRFLIPFVVLVAIAVLLAVAYAIAGRV